MPINLDCDLFALQLVLLNQLLNAPSCALAQSADAADVFGSVTPPSLRSSATSLVSRASRFALQHPPCVPGAAQGAASGARALAFPGDFPFLAGKVETLLDLLLT